MTANQLSIVDSVLLVHRLAAQCWGHNSRHDDVTRLSRQHQASTCSTRQQHNSSSIRTNSTRSICCGLVGQRVVSRNKLYKYISTCYSVVQLRQIYNKWNWEWSLGYVRQPSRHAAGWLMYKRSRRLIYQWDSTSDTGR